MKMALISKVTFSKPPCAIFHYFSILLSIVDQLNVLTELYWLQVRLLLDTGAHVDGRSLMGENKNWTAINYSVLNGHYRTAKLLLDRGAHVEGGALLGDNQPTETPLQLAAASGSVRMVELLLSSGASAFRYSSVPSITMQNNIEMPKN